MGRVESGARSPGARRARLAAKVAGGAIGVAALAAVGLLVVGGIFVPPRYLEAWERGYHERFADPRLQLVAHGLLAPSGHNLQPWVVRLDPADPDVFDVYADPDRLAPAVDPFARQTMVSVGTFLEYIRVAGERLGWRVDVGILPEGAYAEDDLERSMAELPAARVRIAPAASRTSGAYDALFRSDTNRDPYASDALTREQRAALDAVVEPDAATLELIEEPAAVAELGAFAVRGSTIEAGVAAVADEMAAIFRSNEWRKNESPWGFSVEGQGTSGVLRYAMQGLLTLVPALNEGDAAAQRTIDLATAEAAATPAYLLIRTTQNGRADQIEAGMLYSRAQLAARDAGLVVQPLSQVLQEYPAMAGEYAAVHERFATGGETIQMIVRVGVATHEYPRSMRRAVEDLVR